MNEQLNKKEETMEYKVGDKVKITGSPGRGQEGVIHELTSYGYAVDFGRELEFTHRCASYGNPLPKNTGRYYRGNAVELIKEVTMEIPKVYKGFRVVDGELKSLVVWEGQTPSGVGYVPSILTYKEGDITYAPEGTQGIFVEENLETCKRVTNTNKGDSLAVIHKVTPLGNKSLGWDKKVVYPAILLGKEVWRDEPKEESCPFKAGDKVVGTYAGSTGEAFTIDHITNKEVWFTSGTWLFDNQIRLATKEELRPEPKFKVGDRVRFEGLKEVLTIKSVEWLGDHYAYHFNESSNFNSEEYLALAPLKEEWVDVTKECAVVIEARGGYFGYALRLMDGDKHIASFGKQGIIDCCGHDSCYRIEFVQEGGANGGFKVLKKVVK